MLLVAFPGVTVCMVGNGDACVKPIRIIVAKSLEFGMTELVGSTSEGLEQTLVSYGPNVLGHEIPLLFVNGGYIRLFANIPSALKSLA